MSLVIIIRAGLTVGMVVKRCVSESQLFDNSVKAENLMYTSYQTYHEKNAKKHPDLASEVIRQSAEGN